MTRPLFLLSFFAANALARVPHAFALIGLWRAIAANLGRDLTHELLIAAADRNRRGLLAYDLNAGRNRVEHIVAQADLQLQALALQGGTIADSGNLQAFGEPLRHPEHEIVDQRSLHAP